MVTSTLTSSGVTFLVPRDEAAGPVTPRRPQLLTSLWAGRLGTQILPRPLLFRFLSDLLKHQTFHIRVFNWFLVNRF